MWREERYRIRGRVTESITGRALPGLHVRAYDRDLLCDDCLGSCQTDEKGEFEIPFFPHDFREVLEGMPEIYVAIYTPDLDQLHVTEIFRPSAEEIFLDVRVPVQSGRTPGENPANPASPFLFPSIRPAFG